VGDRFWQSVHVDVLLTLFGFQRWIRHGAVLIFLININVLPEHFALLAESAGFGKPAVSTWGKVSRKIDCL
jgi:hypothetical protein